MKVNLRKTIFNGIAVAMGTAVLVAHFVNPMSPGDAASLLAMGVAALGLANLQK
jgi:hypothetical protein